MKTYLIAYVILICGSHAFASEPTIPDGVIAEAYNRYDKSVTTGIRILRNGEVIHFIGAYHETLATLSRPRVVALRKAIDALDAVLLTANEDSAKPCGSEELKLYRVVHSDGKVVTLVKTENCIKYRMENHSDREIKHVIQGFEALAALPR